METQGLTNTICNLHGYLDAPITYQQSKDCPIKIIYCSAPLASKRGGFLSFGRLVGDHRALWIETNENILLGFQQHDIIPPMIQNLYLADPRMINKFNDTLHTSIVKHDIYQGIDYIYNRAIYPLLTHLAWAFERLDELITHLMTCSSPRRPLLLHALSFGCTSKL